MTLRSCIACTNTDLDVFGDFEGAGVAGGDRIALDASIWGADGIVYQVSQTSFTVATAQNTNQKQFIIANLSAPQTTLIAGMTTTSGSLLRLWTSFSTWLL